VATIRDHQSSPTAPKLLLREFGSDLLAGNFHRHFGSAREYLAGSIVLLMLSEGETLEDYAVQNARQSARSPNDAFRALWKRNGAIGDVALDDEEVGDTLVVFFITSVRWMERWSRAMAS
jgi:hypothetical protein